MVFYKYHGAGNDFLIADGRDENIDLTAQQIASVCDRHTGVGADGVMVLERDPDLDFRMRYYNSDGSGGMMCGNGGRCIVAFAADLGFTHFSFNAPDGQHIAELVPGAETSAAFSKTPRIVRLKMRDVSGAEPYLCDASAQLNLGLISPARLSGCDWFLDTGTRHLVHFVDNVADYDVIGEGCRLRHDPRFAPQGVNVNFVQVNVPGQEITVRTFEKGVEDETLACGTGIVASSLATWLATKLAARQSTSCDDLESCQITVHARISDLSVTFTPSLHPAPSASRFTDIWLQGPAAFICRVEI